MPTDIHAQNDATRNLHNLFEEAWQYELKTNPLDATFIGFHKYDDQLPDVSIKAFYNELQKQQIFLDRLKQIDRSIDKFILNDRNPEEPLLLKFKNNFVLKGDKLANISPEKEITLGYFNVYFPFTFKSENHIEKVTVPVKLTADN